jgi:hypothetical protein
VYSLTIRYQRGVLSLFSALARRLRKHRETMTKRG